jgi:2-polyprenyl-3-methyl-5-hydroxy-6-metoxy-1,4-benzoquinol methylase
MRPFSHTQKKEPPLEYLLSEIRFRKAMKYIDRNSVVADLGCGYNGNLLKRISAKIKTGIGYDVSVTKKELPKNITLKRADLNKNIDNRKNYFDAIFALAALEHVESPEDFLKKTRRMLRKSGKIIITTPHKYGKMILELLSFLNLISREEIEDHKNYFHGKSLKKLLDKTGFKTIKLYSFGILWLNLLCVAQKTN